MTTSNKQAVIEQAKAIRDFNMITIEKSHWEYLKKTLQVEKLDPAPFPEMEIIERYNYYMGLAQGYISIIPHEKEGYVSIILTSCWGVNRDLLEKLKKSSTYVYSMPMYKFLQSSDNFLLERYEEFFHIIQLF